MAKIKVDGRPECLAFQDYSGDSILVDRGAGDGKTVWLESRTERFGDDGDAYDDGGRTVIVILKAKDARKLALAIIAQVAPEKSIFGVDD